MLFYMWGMNERQHSVYSVFIKQSNSRISSQFFLLLFFFTVVFSRQCSRWWCWLSKGGLGTLITRACPASLAAFEQTRQRHKSVHSGSSVAGSERSFRQQLGRRCGGDHDAKHWKLKCWSVTRQPIYWGPGEMRMLQGCKETVDMFHWQKWFGHSFADLMRKTRKVKLGLSLS